jgi:hypothetical protein
MTAERPESSAHQGLAFQRRAISPWVLDQSAPHQLRKVEPTLAPRPSGPPVPGYRLVHTARVAIGPAYRDGPVKLLASLQAKASTEWFMVDQLCDSGGVSPGLALCESRRKAARRMETDLRNPIINSPYHPPEAHFEIGHNGPTGKLLPGRLLSESYIPIPGQPEGATRSPAGDVRSRRHRRAARAELSVPVLCEKRPHGTGVSQGNQGERMLAGPVTVRLLLTAGCNVTSLWIQPS